MCCYLAFYFLAGCSSGKAVDNAESYISTVDAMDIPDHVKLIGLGEATHGNVEFQELKKMYLKR